MPFEFASSPVPMREGVTELFCREWDRLASPGAVWSGPERVALAATARAARYGTAPARADLPEAAIDAATTISARPAEPRQGWVDEVAGEIGMAGYAEVVGVVARLSSVDTFHTALGLEIEPLPDPMPGDPTGQIDESVRPGPAWIPMAGGSSIANALAIVPIENDAQRDIHAMYLTYEEMGDIAIVRGLSRAQMELVAGRTSAINECFY